MLSYVWNTCENTMENEVFAASAPFFIIFSSMYFKGVKRHFNGVKD